MKNFLKLLIFCLIGFTTICFAYYKQAIALEINSFEWREADCQDGNTCKMLEYSDGFKAKVTSTTNISNWHIQIISNNVIETEHEPYLINFKVKSDKSFELYSSIHTDYDYNKYLYHNEKFNVIGGDKVQLCELKFYGNPSVKGFLYFFIGLAPVDTVLQISDISIRSIGE